MLTSLHGIYRNGRIEIEKPPKGIQDETPVIVTFLTENELDLRERGIDKKQAKLLRAQLATFSEGWDNPEMSVYDNYDAARNKP
jgi:hypothetical protein